MQKGWEERPADPSTVLRISEATGLSTLTARVLVSRGIDTPEKATAFLHPDLERDWLDPRLIPGLEEVAELLKSAIDNGRRIAVFGDFDLDGLSATALLTRALKHLGADVVPFVPRRFEEGYGLSDLAIDRIMQEDPHVLVTVDCGISAACEVEELQHRGVSVAITDHHEPSGDVPRDVPVADPKLDPSCPSSELAGAGVALKLVQLLGERYGENDLWQSYADLASLGTIADLMPLHGENRALVAAGVRLLQQAPLPGIAALAAVCGTAPKDLSASGMSFSLIPRLNAAGRMGDATPALDLLMADDQDEADRVATSLDACNKKRKSLEKEASDMALEAAQKTLDGSRAIVVADERWHEGIKGIVAAQLVGRFRVPAFVFSLNDGWARGSGRTVGGVDLFAAVSSVSDLLERYGGHKAAVGVTLRQEDLPEFTQRIREYFNTLPREEFQSVFEVDAIVKLDDLSFELLAELDLLRPFGQANPTPLFSAQGVFMNNKARVGAGGEHLKFNAYDGIAELNAIAFRCGDIEECSHNDAPVDIVFEPTVDEWRGKKRLQLFARKIVCAEFSYQRSSERLVEELFDRSEEFLARDEYAGIADAASFHTKLAGVTFEGRQDQIATLQKDTPLRIEREPNNAYDENACGVITAEGTKLGYLNKRLARVLAPLIDAGVEYDATLTEVTGGTDDRSRGVNVFISRRSMSDEEHHAHEEARNARIELEKLTPEALQAEITRRFIGEGQLHPAQQDSLDALARGQSVLTVMATGRGKSLIFHLHAAKVALLEKRASVFVYPLRALVADQAFHLTEAFSQIGLTVQTITGETSQADRDEAFDRLSRGMLDVVLTTPEFLYLHRARFAATDALSFVVVDEAHHVGMARAGHRPAYAQMGEVLEALDHPVVSAVTATADNETTDTIRATLGIEHIVLDPTVRENLALDDRRGARDKDTYLASIVATGEKTVIYVNSRDQSVRIAKMLRKKIPALGGRIAFYNGGLTRSIRTAVENAFRDNELSVIVATSAFGEGVNIPDIRHVFLYHQPFNLVEFNQMSGRCGRDGVVSTIHLMFGPGDARINEMILSSAAPAREDMVTLYRVLRDLQSEHGPAFEITNEEIMNACARTSKGFSLDTRGVSSGIGIFRELGLVSGEGHGAYRKLTVVEGSRKVELTASVRYLEGQDELAEFNDFKEWVLGADSEALLRSFNRPILPTKVFP